MSNKNEPTAFERIEIAMRYTVPLLRDLQEILGKEVVMDALQTRLTNRISAAKEMAKKAAETATTPTDFALLKTGIEKSFEQFSAGEVLDYEIIASDAPTPGDTESMGVDVHNCGYTRLMQSLEATDLGDVLICGEDYPLTAATGVELTRTQTRMTGASHCNFRFRPMSNLTGQ